MKFRFENLEIWQDSRQFINHIYSITKGFPIDEKFGLTDQLRRAAVSIALNIVEGSNRKSDIEFRRYLRMAITSLEEVIAALYIAVDQHYLLVKNFEELYEESRILFAKINALIKTISSRSP